MYADDHNPPHFHINGLDGRDAQVCLGGLSVINGEVDRRALNEAIDWASQNAALLEEAWNDFNPR